MEANTNMMNNMGMMGQFPGINGYYNSPMMQANYQSYMPQGFIPPSNKSTLTDEEIKRIREASKNGSALDITLDPVEYLKELCNHKENFQDIVRQVTDGTGDVYCYLCDERWNADLTYEEAVEVMKKFNDIFQTIKWVGDLPIETARQYAGAAAVINKATLPLYEYAMKNLNKSSGMGSFKNANDANVFAMYDSIVGNSYNPIGMMGQNMYPYANMGMNNMNNMGQNMNMPPYANMGMNNMGMNNMGQNMPPYANMGMNNMGQPVNAYVSPMQSNTTVPVATQPPAYSPTTNTAAPAPTTVNTNNAGTVSETKTIDLS